MMMCFSICISVLYHSKRKLFQYRGKVIKYVGPLQVSADRSCLTWRCSCCWDEIEKVRDEGRVQTQTPQYLTATTTQTTRYMNYRPCEGFRPRAKLGTHRVKEYELED